MGVRISKWGNSLGVRLPKAVVEQLKLASGQIVVIEVLDDAIVIRRKIERPRYGRAELIEQIDPDNVPESFDDAPVGREFL